MYGASGNLILMEKDFLLLIGGRFKSFTPIKTSTQLQTFLSVFLRPPRQREGFRPFRTICVSVKSKKRFFSRVVCFQFSILVVMECTVTSLKEECHQAFCIDRILGLQQENPGKCLKLHRPWAGEESSVLNHPQNK